MKRLLMGGTDIPNFRCIQWGTRSGEALFGVDKGHDCFLLGKIEERFFTARADHFRRAKCEERASARSVRNESFVVR